MPPGVVTVVKLKRPVGSGRWRAYDLGEDEHGRWLFTPAGSGYRGTDGHTVGFCEVAQAWPGGPGRDSVLLVPHDRWWVANWFADGELRCTADICIPCTAVDGVWTYVDLELDPWLRRDGSTGVEDRDEFDRACADGLIDTVERAAALAAVDDLAAVLLPDSPLVSAGARWLARGSSVGLPALPAP